jgi:hypothetical protein
MDGTGDPASCHLPGAKWSQGWGDLRTPPALPPDPSHPYSPGAPCPLGCGRSVKGGRSHALPSPRAFPSRDQEVRWSPAPHQVPGAGPLTSRHAGAQHGGAGPGRCASDASGRRALMSPRARLRAERA